MTPSKVLDEIRTYAESCIADPLHNCEKHRWACRRFLNDLDKMENDPDYPYTWDDDKAQNIIDWFAQLRHSKGVLAGKPIILTPWQIFRIGQLYGWRKKADGYRRFTKAFFEVARKNAKSQEEAGIALYEISITASKNKEVNECYTAGVKRKQSQIVFKEADLMLRGSPLRKFFKITRERIEHKKTGSYIETLSKEDGKTGDGTNPALLIIDEYHEHPNTDFYDLGMGGNTKEALLIIITTAGKDLTYPCFTDEYEYCSKVLNPSVDVENEQYLIDINELEPEDYAQFNNLENEELWIKANPIRATYAKGLEEIRGYYSIAKEVPGKVTGFLTKMMDVWVQDKENGYMNMAKWKSCEVDSDKLPDTKKWPVYVGFDMSAKTDLTSVAFVLPYKTEIKDRDGKSVVRYLVMTHSFIPTREKLAEHIRVDHVPYDAWERMGLLTVTDTPIVDQSSVMRYVIDTCSANKWIIQSLDFDPANASKLMMDLSEEGYIVEEVFQSHKSLNESTQGFREQVICGNITAPPNPLLNYSMSNAVIRRYNGLIKIDKDAARKRIDPVDAILCAYKLAMYHVFTPSRDENIDKFLQMAF